MRYFFILLLIGICLTALLLLVFFKAGKKSAKQKRADRELVLAFGDRTLVTLFEQADTDNERDGIVEFVKESQAREAAQNNPMVLNLTPAGALDSDMSEQTDLEQAAEQTLVGQPTFSAEERRSLPGVAVSGSLADIDWQAIERDLQKRREEESRIMEQNAHIQEVFTKVREMEARILEEPQNNENDN